MAKLENIVISLVGALYLSAPIIGIYENSKFKDIGEGYKVKENGNQRQFFLGTENGFARLAIDVNKDGTLDIMYQNMPSTALMGGPGYRLSQTKITPKDIQKFERAKYILNSI